MIVNDMVIATLAIYLLMYLAGLVIAWVIAMVLIKEGKK